jgi:diguanylate cyclase (GGDEF)-like protein
LGVAALLMWPTFTEDNYRLRIMVVSTVNAAVFLAAARVLWHRSEKRFAEYFTLTVFAATAMVSIARCIAASLTSTVANPLADWSSVQYVYLATFAFSLVALSLGFILMVVKRHQLRLEDAAMRDGLTGVSTRSAFESMARRELAKSRRAQQMSSLLMIDLDNFKAINDQYGHRGGDMVLKEFVRRAGLVLRSHDLFGRYGGEEFVVLLPGTREDVALQIATRLCQVMRETVSPNTPPFTASIGVATMMPDGEDMGEFLNQADKALYRAKAAGKNRVECGAETTAASQISGLSDVGCLSA